MNEQKEKIPMFARVMYISNVMVIAISVIFGVLRALHIIQFTWFEVLAPTIVMYGLSILIFTGVMISRLFKK